MNKLITMMAVPLALALPVAAFAQDEDYPSRTIEIITPFGPGGSTDTAARLFAAHLSEHLPNPVDVVVVNRPGGSTTIGMNATRTAEPDGYTVALTSNSPVTIQPHFPDAGYDLDSFEPVIKLVDIPQILFVQDDAQWESFEDWLAWVRENPGEFTYATPGNGSISDLAMAVLNEAADIETRAIPYDSGGRAMAAMLGGNVDAVTTFQGNADPEQTRPLVNFSSERSTLLKETPTLQDAGIDAYKNAYSGIVAPKGVPEDRIQILHDAFKAALEDPEVVEALRAQSFEISYEGPEEYGQTMQEDFDRNGELLRRAGLIE